MSTATPSAQAALTLLPSDLRGLCALGADGCIGVTDLVEAMHGTIAARAGFGRAAAAQRTTGLTRVVYGAVRGSMRLVAGGIDAGWRGIEPALPRPAASAQRDAFVAALNGLWGDHLAARGNPLAISMALRRDGVALALQRAALARQIPAAGGKLLVLVHGLCMSDRQWTRDGHDHGRMLAQTLGYTPLYLHYNSGLHVSDNGREFAAQPLDLLNQARGLAFEDGVSPMVPERGVEIAHRVSLGKFGVRGSLRRRGAGDRRMRIEFSEKARAHVVGHFRAHRHRLGMDMGGVGFAHAAG